jgi:hypothetical protein
VAYLFFNPFHFKSLLGYYDVNGKVHGFSRSTCFLPLIFIAFRTGARSSPARSSPNASRRRLRTIAVDRPRPMAASTLSSIPTDFARRLRLLEEGWGGYTQSLVGKFPELDSCLEDSLFLSSFCWEVYDFRTIARSLIASVKYRNILLDIGKAMKLGHLP